MSRLAAYVGSSLTLGGFLTEPDNSLLKQTLKAKDAEDMSLLIGGYGYAWYNPGQQTARYLSTIPMWSDPNLPSLAQSMRRRIWVGFTRSGVNYFSTTPENTQPLADDALIFAHDGYVEHFRASLRPHCLRYISAAIEADIAGHTDSEFLFALLRQRMTEGDRIGPGAALAEIMATMEVTLRDVKSILNIILSDGQSVYAIRHATNTECPPMHFCTDNPHFPPGTQLVASDPLTSVGVWQEIPPHHMLTLTPDLPAELVRL